jgi:hypothetical protein
LGTSVPEDDDYLWWATLAKDAAGDQPIYKGNSSAYWYDSDAFFELLQAAGDRTIRSVITRLDGCSGIAGAIAESYSQRDACSLSFTEAEDLLRVIRGNTVPVAERRIRFLGKVFDGHYAKYRGVKRLEPGRGSIVAEGSGTE